MASLTLLKGSFDDADVNNVTARVIDMSATSWAGYECGLIFLSNRQGSGTPPSPTITGGWSSWNVETTRASGTVAGICVAVGTGTPTNGQNISIAYGGSVSSLAVTYAVCGAVDVPSDPIGLLSANGGTASSATVTLSGTLADANSEVYAWVCANNGTAFNADSGWTELTEPNSTTPVLNTVLVENLTQDQTYAANWGSSIGYGWIILELLHEAAAPSGTNMRAYDGSSWVDVSEIRIHNGTSFVPVSEAREI